MIILADNIASGSCNIKQLLLVIFNKQHGDRNVQTEKIWVRLSKDSAESGAFPGSLQTDWIKFSRDVSFFFSFVLFLGILTPFCSFQWLLDFKFSQLSWLQGYEFSGLLRPEEREMGIEQVNAPKLTISTVIQLLFFGLLQAFCLFPAYEKLIFNNFWQCSNCFYGKTNFWGSSFGYYRIGIFLILVCAQVFSTR